MEEETNIQGENILDEEAEKEKLKNRALEEVKGDWINEFSKVHARLELAKMTGEKKYLYSPSGEKYALKMLWERYPDFKKDIILEMESEYQEIKEMRESLEKSNTILEAAYDFLENNKEKTDEFKNRMAEFYTEFDEQVKNFLRSKSKLEKENIKDIVIK